MMDLRPHFISIYGSEVRMSIRKKIKKRLPIFGRKNNVPAGNEQDRPRTTSAVPTSTPTWMQPEAEPETHRGEVPVIEYIEKVIKDNKIVLFMKGSPTNPLCGFSANAAGILSTYDKEFAHVDVIADYEVREGIKDFSQWPTLPQVYVKGEFVGGSDILSEMHQDGSFSELLT
jgi:monothiol glutaredoxin